MKAYITSIGERTTDLCRWSLERNGFETVLLESETPLWAKLRQIYEMATDDFVRIDADVIVNQRLTPEFITEKTKIEEFWWTQFMTYDWYLQDITHGGIQFIKKEALPALKDNIFTFRKAERPESQMFRLDEFHKPRRCVTYTSQIMGLNGYAQNDLERVKETKRRRKQPGYDWELVERLNIL